MQTPQNIRVVKEDGILELVWSEDDVSRLPFQAVRRDCRCAACVDEFTGRKILDPETIAESIVPEDVKLTGNYAIKFRWSDAHDTGLFTWDHLRELADRLRESTDNSNNHA